MTSLNGVRKRRLAAKETSIDSCEPLDTLLFIYYYFLNYYYLFFLWKSLQYTVYFSKSFKFIHWKSRKIAEEI